MVVLSIQTVFIKFLVLNICFKYPKKGIQAKTGYLIRISLPTYLPVYLPIMHMGSSYS